MFCRSGFAKVLQIHDYNILCCSLCIIPSVFDITGTCLTYHKDEGVEDVNEWLAEVLKHQPRKEGGSLYKVNILVVLHWPGQSFVHDLA